MRTCSCGRPIADNVAACPYCGKVYTTTATALIAVVLIGIVVIFILAVIAER